MLRELKSRKKRKNQELPSLDKVTVGICAYNEEMRARALRDFMKRIIELS